MTLCEAPEFPVRVWLTGSNMVIVCPSPDTPAIVFAVGGATLSPPHCSVAAASRPRARTRPSIAAVPTTDTTPQRTAKFIEDELAKWAPVIKAANIRLD